VTSTYNVIKAKYGTFCIMGQRLNLFCKLNWKSRRSESE